MKIDSIKDIKTAREALDSSSISALELTKFFIEKIKEENAKNGNYLLINEDLALIQAKKADQRLSSGERGALLGIPYLVKDNILSKNTKTSAGLEFLKDYQAPYQAKTLEQLDKAGAILVAKIRLEGLELANFKELERKIFSKNLALFSVSSTSLPRSFSEIKENNFLEFSLRDKDLARHGLVNLSSSFDTISLLAKNEADLASLDSVFHSTEKDISSKGEDLKNLKIALFKPSNFESLEEGQKIIFNKALANLSSLGIQVESLELTFQEELLASLEAVYLSELSSNMARFSGYIWGKRNEELFDSLNFLESNRDSFSWELKKQILLGTNILKGEFRKEYERLIAWREKLELKYQGILKDFDLAISVFDYKQESIEKDLKLRTRAESLAPLLLAPLIKAPSLRLSLSPRIGLELIKLSSNPKQVFSLSNLLRQVNLED